MASLASAPPSTDLDAAPVTRLTWAHAAPVSLPAFTAASSSGAAHEPWIREPVLPRITPVIRAACLALVVGVVGGVATAYVERLVGSPVRSHVLAPWAAITTGVGFALRGRWQVAAMAGLVTQIGLVLGFCLSQHAFNGGPVSAQSVASYVVLALVAGPICGASAGLLRHPRSPRDSLRNLGVAAGVGAFILVALVLHPGGATQDTPPALRAPGIGQSPDLP